MSALATRTPAAIDLLAHRVDQAHRAAAANDETRAREQLKALATEAGIMATRVPFALDITNDND